MEINLVLAIESHASAHFVPVYQFIVRYDAMLDEIPQITN